MGKISAALQASLDGFIEGARGELDWAMTEDKELWKDGSKRALPIIRAKYCLNNTGIRRIYPLSGYEDIKRPVHHDPGKL